MLHTVEVHSFRGGVIAVLSNMMTWLDIRGSQPVVFRQVAVNGTAFRLDFTSEAEALAFVCAFGGRLVRPEAEASVA